LIRIIVEIQGISGFQGLRCRGGLLNNSNSVYNRGRPLHHPHRHGRLQETHSRARSAEQRIKAARQDAISGAIAKIQSLIAEFELTPQDVFPPAPTRSFVAGTKVAPKYRDPATGQTWTGRRKAAQVDSGSGSRQIRDLICICSL
jgi:DNA-binding protein H-NS